MKKLIALIGIILLTGCATEVGDYGPPPPPPVVYYYQTPTVIWVSPYWYHGRWEGGYYRHSYRR